MTAKPHRLRGLALLLFLAAAPLRAEEPELSRLLRDALYTEEVSRDPEGAAKAYEEILQRHDRQRAFAATALFRLAEVRRKQERDDESVELYQRLIREFPDAAAESKLAKENLAALGGEIPPAGTGPGGEEAEELRRLQELAETAPDLLRDPATLERAVVSGYEKAVDYLLSNGAKPRVQTFREAVDAGRIGIVKRLLDAGELPADAAGRMLAEAIDLGRVAVLKTLLDEGMSPEFPADWGKSSLMYAVEEEKIDAARLLLKAGVDVNFMAEPGDARAYKRSSRGTALHVAVGKDPAIFDLLLEHGAKPLPDPFYGKTPLHVAAASKEPSAIGQLKRLLELGADPNLRSREVPADQSGRVESWGEARTSLELAVLAGSAEKVELLLAGGAKPADGALPAALESESLDLVDLLIEAGTDVDRPVVVAAALGTKDAKILDRVLEAGANPNVSIREHVRRFDLANIGQAPLNSHYPLQYAAMMPDGLPLVEVLLKHGAEPGGDWLNNYAFHSPPEVRELLAVNFLYPELAENPAIMLQGAYPITRKVITRQGPSHETEGGAMGPFVELVVRSEDEDPPQLAALLLRSEDAIQKLGNELWPMQLVLYRKAQNGFRKHEIHLDSEDEFPMLEWGDIIQIVRDQQDVRAHGWPSRHLWHLRKRISFPITVEIEGKSRQLMVRGDRLTFDPTEDEVPLTTLDRLIGWLWQPLEDIPARETRRAELVIEREGSPKIRLPRWGDATEEFELLAGDRVKLVKPKDIEAIPRSENIAVVVPGYPFVRHYDTYVPEAPAPTLFQAVTDAMACGAFTADVAEDLPGAVGTLVEQSPEGVLPHPDFSKIRLRRLTDDGKEDVRQVDLSAMIATAGETGDGELRRLDVPLRKGDIVELPLREDRLDQPWTGLSEDEASFFARALRAQVQVSSEEGDEVVLREVECRPLQFIETEAGWLPFKPMAGSVSMRASELLDYSGRIASLLRDGETFSKPIPASSLFVRDGDTIVLERRNHPTPPAPEAQSSPRVTTPSR